MPQSLCFRCLCLFALAGCASAQNIWVGKVNSGTSFNFSPTFFQNELTNFGSSNTSLAFYTHTNGDTGLAAWDLILGFANGGPATAPTVTSIAAYSNVGNVDSSQNITLGSSKAPTAVTISPSQTATFTSGSQDAYIPLGLPNGQGSPSENFSNWTGAESSIGINATSFTLYMYNLSAYSSTLGDYGLLDITFNTALQQGAFAIGFGCSVSNNCKSNSTRDNSVFTQTGFAAGPTTPSSVPEPSSYVLFASVAAFAVLVTRKNKGQTIAG